MSELEDLFQSLDFYRSKDKKGQAKNIDRFRTRPDKHTQRKAWNYHFERDISRKYDSFTYTCVMTEDRTDYDTISCWQSSPITELNQDNAILTKEIMEVEGHLIARASENIVYGSFEADWKKLDVEKKKEIVLEGLYRGACDAPRDNSRISCPEMTIKGLIGDSEYNLINLVSRTIVFEDLILIIPVETSH